MNTATQIDALAKRYYSARRLERKGKPLGERRMDAVRREIDRLPLGAQLGVLMVAGRLETEES